MSAVARIAPPTGRGWFWWWCQTSEDVIGLVREADALTKLGRRFVFGSRPQLQILYPSH